MMTQNESWDIRQLAVSSEQKLYYFCYDSNRDNCHLGPVLGPICHRTSLTIKFNRAILPGICHVACES